MDHLPDKPSLRNHFKQVLFDIKNFQAKSQSIIENLQNTPVFQKSSNILLYSSTKFEINTASLIRDSLLMGKKVYLPRINEHKIIQINLESKLSSTSLGIKQPNGPFAMKKDLDALEVVVLPGLAFDNMGYRLGHGNGWYDIFLSSLPLNVTKIGLCFNEQLINQLPHFEHDLNLDIIITDQKILYV